MRNQRPSRRNAAWRHPLGIGVSVFLLAVGAILAFAVTDTLSSVDLTSVGYILTGAGAIGLALAAAAIRRRGRVVGGGDGPSGAERVVTRERDTY